MNRALNIINLKDGGNNYVLHVYSINNWVGFAENIINGLKQKFGDNFNIVVYFDKQKEDDYYCIPFRILSHLFIDRYKTKGTNTKRWTAKILNDEFLMCNANLPVDIADYFSIPLIAQSSTYCNDDYIENAKTEINIRLGQSKFRKNVLSNFENKCALTDISEHSLLTASHIVPWSHNKASRGDISNGICLYIEYDALFDKGFISFKDDLEIIIIPDTNNLSKKLQARLRSLKGKRLSKPINKQIDKKYLEYHRTKIFNKRFTAGNQVNDTAS